MVAFFVPPIRPIGKLCFVTLRRRKMLISLWLCFLEQFYWKAITTPANSRKKFEMPSTTSTAASTEVRVPAWVPWFPISFTVCLGNRLGVRKHSLSTIDWLVFLRRSVWIPESRQVQGINQTMRTQASKRLLHKSLCGLTSLGRFHDWPMVGRRWTSCTSLGKRKWQMLATFIVVKSMKENLPVLT